MDSAKTAQIVVKLLNLTTANKIAWEKTSSATTFQTSLPEYTLRLTKVAAVTSQGSRTVFKIEILNSEGATIESASDRELDKVDQQGSQKIRELFDIARRRALRIDESLDDILRKLDK